MRHGRMPTGLPSQANSEHRSRPRCGEQHTAGPGAAAPLSLLRDLTTLRGEADAVTQRGHRWSALRLDLGCPEGSPVQQGRTRGCPAGMPYQDVSSDVGSQPRVVVMPYLLMEFAPVAGAATFSRPMAERWFEDYVPGISVEYGSYRATEEEIIDFGRRFDPHVMHTDARLARSTPLGGLVASGWHTNAMMMRILVESYLNQAASVASPGVDELRWPRPVRPGDVLHARFTVLGARTSASRPDRGIVRTRIELRDQDDVLVMGQVMTNIILRA